MARKTCKIVDSQDHKFIGYRMIELHHADTYKFPCGRTYTVASMALVDTNRIKILFQDGYWIITEPQE